MRLKRRDLHLEANPPTARRTGSKRLVNTSKKARGKSLVQRMDRKWQLEDEEAVAQALALRDDFLLHGRVNLIAPFLLTFELTNGMLTATRQGRLSRDQAEEGLGLLLAAGIRLMTVDPTRIFSLSMRWKLSAYGGAYLGLAEKLDSEVWTGDRAFYTACRGKKSRVRWIGDYPRATR